MVFLKIFFFFLVFLGAGSMADGCSGPARVMQDEGVPFSHPRPRRSTATACVMHKSTFYATADEELLFS